VIPAIMTKYQGVEIFVIPPTYHNGLEPLDIWLSCKLSKFCAHSIVTGIEAFL